MCPATTPDPKYLGVTASLTSPRINSVLRTMAGTSGGRHLPYSSALRTRLYLDRQPITPRRTTGYRPFSTGARILGKKGGRHRRTSQARPRASTLSNLFVPEEDRTALARFIESDINTPLASRLLAQLYLPAKLTLDDYNLLRDRAVVIHGQELDRYAYHAVHMQTPNPNWLGPAPLLMTSMMRSEGAPWGTPGTEPYVYSSPPVLREREASIWDKVWTGLTLSVPVVTALGLGWFGPRYVHSAMLRNLQARYSPVQVFQAAQPVADLQRLEAAMQQPSAVAVQLLAQDPQLLATLENVLAQENERIRMTGIANAMQLGAVPNLGPRPVHPLDRALYDAAVVAHLRTAAAMQVAISNTHANDPNRGTPAV